MSEGKTLALTAQDLKELIATAVSTAVAEVRKPDPPTPQQVAALEMEQEHRRETAEADKQARENKRNAQLICSHEHARAIGGFKTHCVYIKESDPVGSPGYILCQDCQGRFRPETANRKLDPNAHYNTAVFNKLFQDCAVNDVIGG